MPPPWLTVPCWKLPPGAGTPQPVSWALFQEDGFWPPPARNAKANGPLRLPREQRIQGAVSPGVRARSGMASRRRLRRELHHGYGLITFMIRPELGSAQ
jgi:hypothetical protein